MAGAKQGSNNVLSRWLIVLVLIIFVPLVIDFNARLFTIRQMRQEEAQLTRDIAAEQARREQLEAWRQYVNSDEYVEYWARVEARMAYAGEVAVIPVAQESARVEAAPSPSNVPPSSPLDEWWALFFEASIIP